MGNSLYIAITFGPITRVIAYAKSTKELWAASYLFSYLAKQVVEPFKTRTFLLPQIAEEMYDKTKTHGAGLFPDRCIFKAEDHDFDKLCDHCDKLYTQLGTDIAEVIGKPEEINAITLYLKQTIKIYCFEKGFSETENIVHNCEDILATMECQDVFQQNERDNYLSCFFEKVNGSFLTDDAFEKDTVRLFETIIEYSAVELNRGEYWESINKNGKEIKQIRNSALRNEKRISEMEKNNIIKPYHKYIAFVKADGDHLTKTINGLKEKGIPVSELDQRLLKYNLEVINLIEDYQGKAISLGGDDLLFFAPVRNGVKNIFTLLQEINATFDDAMIGLPSSPTLSFGVSISYHKHPMFEAIEMAEELLHKAKDAGRNRIAWYLRKHSGQICQSIIKKENKSAYDQCIALIGKGMINKDSTENFFNSFTYWLLENKEMIMYILSLPDTNDAEKKVIEQTLTNYFENSFNEPQHEKMGDYMKALIQYLMLNTKEHSALNEEKEYTINSLCSTLRFIGFLKSEKL